MKTESVMKSAKRKRKRKDVDLFREPESIRHRNFFIVNGIVLSMINTGTEERKIT